MPYPRILAFVEGHMERLFINNNFPYISVITVSNGVSWTTDALAKQVSTLYRARNFNGDAVLVWIDREKRLETAEEIDIVLRRSLISAGAPESSIHILVADNMSENIILSDEAVIREITGQVEYTYSYESQGGKHKLKEFLKVSGIQYRETTVGVHLLKRIRLGNCALNSPAVARFLATMNLPCWWLETRNNG